jgi:hypothetical protein
MRWSRQPSRNPNDDTTYRMELPLTDPSTSEAIVFGLVFLIVLGALVPRIFRQKPQWRHNNRKRKSAEAPYLRLIRQTLPDVLARSSNLPSSDPAEQLRAVMAGTFTAKNVLSRTEAGVMRAAEKAIAEAGLNWRVMAQVALGEILASPDEAAFRAINAKRVDLLVVSAKSEPLAAIEYQGQGHYQGTAPARDAIKKEALRKAGIRYIEITFEHGPEDVKREIDRMAWFGKVQNSCGKQRITTVG